MDGNATHLYGLPIGQTNPVEGDVLGFVGGKYVPQGFLWEEMDKLCVAFDYTTSSPLILYYTGNGTIITGARIHIETFFDGAATLSIGHAGNVDAVIASSENNPLELGDYETTRFLSYAGVDTIRLYVNAGAATQGAGHVLLGVRKNNLFGSVLNSLNSLTNAEQVEITSFNENTVSPLTVYTADHDSGLLKVEIEVTVAATGGNPSLCLGTDSIVDLDMLTTENDLKLTGCTEICAYRQVDTVNNPLRATIVSDGQVFSGVIRVYYVRE